MKRMASSNVFLSGLGGLGIEIGNIENVAYNENQLSSFTAKNITLAGIKVSSSYDIDFVTTQFKIFHSGLLSMMQILLQWQICHLSFL